MLAFLNVYANKTYVDKDDTRRTQQLYPLGKLTKEEMLQHLTHSDVFKQVRGKLLGTTMHITLDPSVSCVTPQHELPQQSWTQ